ncbi:di-trans,poly-cis-decaprenylcistransferase [Candidatus Bathyarchaeota archaeon]|nr:di-trans,poly-cis-decaprenylcistransferase [Candidatus Bathyarchaeota archaeon]
MIKELLETIGVYSLYHKWLEKSINRGEKPNHIGVIMDGNRRWARARDLVPWEGHWEGADKVENFLDWCLDLDIKTITLYSFSTENFKRDQKEVTELFKLFESMLERVIKSDRIHKNRVCIRAIGRIETLPEKLQELIQRVEESTQDYDDYYLNIAIAYGGRAEIVDAVQVIAEKVKMGQLEPSDISEQVIEANLYTSHLPYPDPDIIIRTSGESRLSNFLVWQSAYSELFLVDVYWPNFRKIDLMRAIRGYQMRQRRFGG